MGEVWKKDRYGPETWRATAVRSVRKTKTAMLFAALSDLIPPGWVN
jgi:hypothetical protein